MKNETLVQKIIGSRSGGNVLIGEIVLADVDRAMGHDITGPAAAAVLRDAGIDEVWDKEKVVMVADHFVPAKDLAAAKLGKELRVFSEDYEVGHYYGEGRGGICHVVMPEDGLVAPGEIIIGADSHTCTNGALGALATGVGHTDLAAVLATGKVWLRVPESIKVTYLGKPAKHVSPKDLSLALGRILTVQGANYQTIEFHDETESGISMEGRLTIANMAIEWGAKAGIFVPDKITEEFVKGRVKHPYKAVYPDKGATYSLEIEIDTGQLEPLIAQPFSPDNVIEVRKLEKERIKIDQVFVGSCTNARIGDLREVGEIFRMAPGVSCKAARVVIIPGDQKTYLKAVEEGLAKLFVERGCVFSTPTCGPCLGGHGGVMAAGEVCLSTSNRNFHGRMGHPDSLVYLASPRVAALSAIKGTICGPQE
ncbi:3-isopropylmalate dehydratase large subunit [bacterium]|nr:3-isopropylmalate dehydratase large subunit [bacterium]